MGGAIRPEAVTNMRFKETPKMAGFLVAAMPTWFNVPNSQLLRRRCNTLPEYQCVLQSHVTPWSPGFGAGSVHRSRCFSVVQASSQDLPASRQR